MIITRDNTYNQFVPGIKPRESCASGDRLRLRPGRALWHGAGNYIPIGKISDWFFTSKGKPRYRSVMGGGRAAGRRTGDKNHNILCLGKGFFVVPNNGPASSKTVNGREYVEFEALTSGELLEINTGRRFPTNPMIGVIGTASKGDRPWYATECGDHGGNMDCNTIRAGAAVYLPVFVEGGLLGIGDVHAAMGDGEVYGSGVDISAEVDITVTVRKDIKNTTAFLLSGNHLSTLASAVTLEEACRLCIKDMEQILQVQYGFTPLDASKVIALYGDLKICQIANPQKTVRMEITLDKLNLFS